MARLSRQCLRLIDDQQIDKCRALKCLARAVTARQPHKQDFALIAERDRTRRHLIRRWHQPEIGMRQPLHNSLDIAVLRCPHNLSTHHHAATRILDAIRNRIQRKCSRLTTTAATRMDEDNVRLRVANLVDPFRKFIFENHRRNPLKNRCKFATILCVQNNRNWRRGVVRSMFSIY